MEQALKISEERFRGIVETTEERVWECDLQLRMTYNNPALMRLLGYEPTEMLGKNSVGILDEEDQEAHTNALQARKIAEVRSHAASLEHVIRMEDGPGFPQGTLSLDEFEAQKRRLLET